MWSVTRLTTANSARRAAGGGDPRLSRTCTATSAIGQDVEDGDGLGRVVDEDAEPKMADEQGARRGKASSARSPCESAAGSRDEQPLDPWSSFLWEEPARASMVCEVVTATADRSPDQTVRPASESSVWPATLRPSLSEPEAKSALRSVSAWIYQLPSAEHCRGGTGYAPIIESPGQEDRRAPPGAGRGPSSRDIGVFAATRFRIGGIAFLTWPWRARLRPPRQRCPRAGLRGDSALPRRRPAPTSASRLRTPATSTGTARTTSSSGLPTTRTPTSAAGSAESSTRSPRRGLDLAGRDLRFPRLRIRARSTGFGTKVARLGDIRQLQAEWLRGLQRR